MNQREADEKQKLSRRVFIQYSTVATGAASGIYALTLKTDATAQQPGAIVPRADGTMSYPYH